MQDFHPLQPDAYIEPFVHSSVMERIAPFQVMILYDREKNSFDSAYLEHFPSKKVKEEVAENNIFPIIQSETFIIWQEMYEENHHLFYKLRLRARKEMMQRVTDFLVAKFFVIYEASLFPFLQTDFHRKWKFMESLHAKFEQSLEKQTKLTSETAWEQFNQWFKSYLTKQILSIMEKRYGADQLNQMPADTINPLFFQEMNKNLSDNQSFLQEFTKMVNHYLKSGVEHVYLNIKNVTVYLEGRPKTIDVKGYLLQQMKKGTEKLDVYTHFQFRLHAVFQHFLMGSLRQTKLFSKQVIAYDPYRKKWEKRLGRYLSWRWRTQARKGNYIQPHKVGTLLGKINMQENYTAPSRLRNRLETALDVLAEDGVIQSWQYESWDEAIALKKGWFEKWK